MCVLGSLPPQTRSQWKMWMTRLRRRASTGSSRSPPSESFCPDCILYCLLIPLSLDSICWFLYLPRVSISFTFKGTHRLSWNSLIYSYQDWAGPGFQMTRVFEALLNIPVRQKHTLYLLHKFDSLTSVDRYVEAAILKCNRFLNKA